MTNYTFPRGDTRILTVTVVNPPSGVDLTNYDVWFTLKADRATPDPGDLQKHKAAGSNFAQGITVLSPASLQQCTIAIAPADTLTLGGARTDAGRVYWDVQVRAANGDTTTVDAGYLVLTPDTTQA